MKLTRILYAFFFLAFFSIHTVYAQQTFLDAPTVTNLKASKQASNLSPFIQANDYRLTDDFESRGRRYIYLQQSQDGIPYDGVVSVVVMQAERVLSVRNSFSKPSVDKTPVVAINVEQAVAIAAGQVELPSPILPTRQESRFAKDRVIEFLFPDNNLSNEAIKAFLVWKKQTDEQRLCWKIEIYTKDLQHYWQVFVDAVDGQVLESNDLVLHCKFDCQEEHTHTHAHSHVKPSSFSVTSSPSSVATYRVFDTPVESPTHGGRSLAVDPWLRAGGGNPATTLQWHDDGSSTYINTRGNNVHAYEDTLSQNSPGYSPSSASLNFDYTYDQFNAPQQNLDAAITNLFFWNNLMHDIFYQYGFDEPSGNFQEDNLGRGGAGNDYVRAEGLDGSGTNNANFFTPADGNRPRMQMYIWSTVSPPPDFEVNSPGNIAGFYNSVESSFSNNNKLIDVGPVTGDLELVDDGTGTPTDACQTIQNAGAINGKIALIDRGNCNFRSKVLRAQNAGAIAAVVANNAPGQPPFAMGGTDNSITIPAVMISYEDGQILRNEMQNNTVNITLTGKPTYTPDSDLDNGIICHEYGHGISIRLTGGPATSCLGNQEQMGEGWSDYFGLMLTTDWSTAQATDIRGIGTYVLGQNNQGTGIRNFPYTTDTSVNPFTYASIQNGSVSVPHGVGSVWCTMLWDMTWALVADKGASTDLYNGNAGNNIAMNLVVEALKLQPCNPGFVDGRDAILEADKILYNGDHNCIIWEAFAARGLGVNADQGSTSSRSDGSEDFTVPDGLSIIKTASANSVRERDTITYEFEVESFCEDRFNITITDTLPAGFTHVAGSGGSEANGIVTFGPFSLPEVSSTTFSFKAVRDYGTHEEPTTFLDDDVESGNGTWTVSRAKPASGNPDANWQIDNAESRSPVNSWFSPDNDFETDLYLTSQTFNFTGFNDPILSFWHYYDTEAGWDGGVVEISVNNGAWADLGNDFLVNGYNQTIATNPASSISGREAFSGINDSFQLSIIDLGAYSGQSNVRIRFRFAADGFVGGDGWYIDDIVVADKQLQQNIAYVRIIDTLFDQSTVFTETECGPAEFLLDSVNGVATTYVATEECTDDLGWTHYYYEGDLADPADDRLLLSIRKDGQDIGGVGDGVFEVAVIIEPEYGTGTAIDLSDVSYLEDVGADNWFVANRWWRVTPNASGGGGQLTTPVTVRYYMTDRDRQDINGSLAANGYDTLTTATAFELYKVDAVDPAPTFAVHNPLLLGRDFLRISHGAVPADTSWAVPAGGEVQFPVSGTLTMTQFVANTFSGGGVGAFGFNQVLPVTLSTFDAVAQDDCSHRISWRTSSELNCARFELQASYDAQTFTSIYEAECALESVTEKSYAYTNRLVDAEGLYYRLKQVDTDGSVDYSPLLFVVNTCAQSTISIRPIPADTELLIRIADAEVAQSIKQMQVYDTYGRRVFQQVVNDPLTSDWRMDVSAYQAGVYWLQLRTAQGQVYTKRFVVQ